MTGLGQNVRKSISFAKIGAVLMIYGLFLFTFRQFFAILLPYLACMLAANLTRLFGPWGSHSGQEAGGRIR